MKITKQSFGYVLETGCAVIVFKVADIEKVKIAGIDLWDMDEHKGFIPNQHIKEFEQKFIEAGGVIE